MDLQINEFLKPLSVIGVLTQSNHSKKWQSVWRKKARQLINVEEIHQSVVLDSIPVYMHEK